MFIRGTGRRGPFFAHPPVMKRLLASRLFKLGAMLAVLPAAAFAHPGHDGGHDLTWDFSGGFAHPLGGLDHLLAMITVGLWAAQVGGRARWLVPAVFVGMLSLGAFAAQRGMAPAATEQLIAASLLALGLMVVMGKQLPFGLGVVLTALFGAFHGFAHGSEIPDSSGGFSYALGFFTATVLLHCAGLTLGSIQTSRFNNWAKTAGVGVATVGAVMLVAS